jgi:TolA-binding protein
MTSNQVETPKGLQSVENALSRTEKYIEENQKSLTIIILAIVVVVGGYLGYKKFYLEPANREALAAMYIAEQYFEKDSFNLALNGDGANYGFSDIIDEYGVTTTANLAHYYAGVCCMRTGLFDEAIEHFEKFDDEDIMVATLALGNMGDCYLELDQKEKAASLYMKAGQRKRNSFTSPIFLKKAGLVYDSLEQYEKAVKAFEILEKKYPDSEEGVQAKKYLAAIRTKMTE